MVRAAPRYSPLILDWVRELDDPSEPIAETCRRVGERAEALGLSRPSYSHLRRIVRRERAWRELEERRRATIRVALGDAAVRLAGGRFVDPAYVHERIRSANERAVRAAEREDERT
jgi:putative intracellular protease/amidase